MRSPFSESITQLCSRLFANHRIQRWRSLLVDLVWRAVPTAFASIIIIAMVYLGALQPIELWAYNSFTNWRGDRPWDERLVIVAIDDVSIRKIGRFPWTRDYYVQLLQKLAQTETSVIGFDILWSEASAEDQQLAEAIGKYQRVVLSMAWDNSGQPLLPISPLSNAGVAVGHILKREEGDGIVRQMDLQIQDVPSLAVSILQTYNLTSKSITLLPDLNQTVTINWTQRVNNIPHFSFSDVIDGKVAVSEFRNKIVLVGVTASGLDSLVTPFDRNPPANGVHLHAMVLQNLLQKSSLSVIGNQDIWSFALLGSLLISLILPRRNLWLGSISAFVLSGLWLAIAFIAFSNNYWLKIAIPMLMFLITGFVIAIQERWQMQRSLHIADAQIQYEVTHDRLTGLFNRSFMEAKLRNLLNPQDVSTTDRYSAFQASEVQRTVSPNSAAKQSPTSLDCETLSPLLAVIWVNIDRFKTINDTFGRPTGNLLLIEVSKCLRDVVRTNASMARFGGAEFVILLENLVDEQTATNIAEQIQNRLQKPFLIAGHEIGIATNIGIKFHQINADPETDPLEISPDLLLRDADTAMFYAQKTGNSCIKIFHVAMRERVLERLQLEKDLRKAVALLQDPHQTQQEFLIYYQPILSLNDMQIVGLEALIRWQQPERGLVSPTYFIPLAEETGLIIPIGDWIMRNACLQIKSWHQNFEKAKDITISVNLSPKQLAQDDVLEKCLNILQETKLSAEYLKIELTESSLMENPDFAVSVLQKMREAGIKIYIDDFGTGYSSLAYLHKFPFDGLKIDRSFVNNIHANSSGAEILQAIVSLAQSVKAHIVAEGIENLEQLNYLQDLLSREGDGQGFFLFRPLEVVAIETIFQTT